MKLGAITEMPGTGTLIVTGYAYRMGRVEQLLEIIDKPGKPRAFKFRQLRYTMASTLAPKVKQLVEQLGEISITIATPQPATPSPIRRAPVRQPMPPQPVQPPGAGAGAAKPTIYLDADERTNRILMIGNEHEIAVVDELIDALDVEQQDIRSIRSMRFSMSAAKRSKETRAWHCRSRQKPPRAGLPPGLPGPRALGQPRPQMPIHADSSVFRRGTGFAHEEVQVVIIESTNAIMVNASPEQHTLIATIIAYVDSETIQQAIPYVVYPLENQNPTDLAEVLNKLIQETILDKEGKIQEVIKRQEEEIVIVPDESTFSLIVFAAKNGNG
jgi:type II secretory pathway component GspD/PulD (secretin)